MLKLVLQYFALCLWMSIPLLAFVQKVWHWPALDGLGGFYTIPKMPRPTLESWLNSSYQDSIQLQAEATVGYHDLLVRFRNQLDYSIFRRAHSGLLVGQDDILFGNDYAMKYYGIDTADRTYLNKHIGLIKSLQTCMRKHNKLLMVVLAPNKASYLPEKLPNIFDKSNIDNSDYRWIIKLLTQNQIDYIDFDDYFNSIKRESPYPLFPNLGTHWSVYGSMVAADSITRYIELRQNVKVVPYSITNGQWSDSARFQDWDLYGMLNLLQDFPLHNLWYPSLAVDTASVAYKPSVLIIGDSFCWQMYYQSFPQKIFAPDFQYWYYGETIWPASENAGYEIHMTPDVLNQALNHDVVILLDGWNNYYQLGHGRLEALLQQCNSIKNNVD